MISLRSQAWLPRVITSAPAARKARAISGARPKPWLAFSPFTTTRSARSFAFSPGSAAISASRPERPTTSPRNRIRKRSGPAFDHASFGRHASSPTSPGPAGTAPFPARRSRSRARWPPAAAPGSGRNSRPHSRAAARPGRRPAAAPAASPGARTRRKRVPGAHRAAAPAVRPGASGGRPAAGRAAGVTGSTMGWPRAASASSSGRMSISWPIGQKPATTAPAGGGASPPAPARQARCPAPDRSRPAGPARHRRASAFSSRSGSSQRGMVLSAEPAWPLAYHPPKACECRWAPDTRTKIRTEPAPGGCLLALGMNYLTHRPAPPPQYRRHRLPGLGTIQRLGETLDPLGDARQPVGELRVDRRRPAPAGRAGG